MSEPKDYILRSKAIKAVTGWQTDPTDEELEWALLQVPSADVVEVVRCKDCKYDSLCFSDVEMTNRSKTENIYKQIEWCSYGERKDG